MNEIDEGFFDSEYYVDEKTNERVILNCLRSIYGQVTPLLRSFCPIVLIDLIYLYMGFFIVHLSNESMNSLLNVNEDDLVHVREGRDIIEKRTFEKEMQEIIGDLIEELPWNTWCRHALISREQVSFIWYESTVSNVSKSTDYPQLNSICEINLKDTTLSPPETKSVWMFNSITDYRHEVDHFHYLFPSFETLVVHGYQNLVFEDKIITFQQKLQNSGH